MIFGLTLFPAIAGTGLPPTFRAGNRERLPAQPFEIKGTNGLETGFRCERRWRQRLAARETAESELTHGSIMSRRASAVLAARRSGQAFLHGDLHDRRSCGSERLKMSCQNEDEQILYVSLPR